MNTYKEVDQMIDNWTKIGMSKAEIVVATAEACMGWPYVFGARGAVCTPSNRKARASAEHPTIVSRCQVLNGKHNSCSGCKWGAGCRMYDCRGFTYWVFRQVGIEIMGAGATSQWNDDSNWTVKGPISDMPLDQVCCVFMHSTKTGKKEHTGVHIGGGQIIHCSNGVQTGQITDKGWTHYAIPRGMDGTVPVRKPTLKRGSTGEYVVECQKDLIQLGFDVGKTGADGKFGKNTEKAVKSFQTSKRLAADGIVGQATWAALDAAVGPTPGPGPEPGLYTVSIPHLDKTQAERICTVYPDAIMTAEGGE